MKLTPKLINLISLMMETAEQVLEDEEDLRVVHNWYKKVASQDDLFLTARAKESS